MQRKSGFCITALIQVLAVLAALLGLVFQTGCTAQKQVGVAGLPAEYQPIVGIVAESIKEQGVLDKWMANGRVRGQRPGLEWHITSDNSVGVRLSGIALEAEGEVEGQGYANIPGEIMAYILDQAKSGDESADALLLKWFEGRADWRPGPARGGTASSPAP